MENQINGTRGYHRPKSNQIRWAWMAGATAAAAAAPHAQAQTAQISLINNQIDSISGVHMTLAVTSGHPFGSLYEQKDSAASVVAVIKVNGIRNTMEALILNHLTFFALLTNTGKRFATIFHPGPDLSKQTAFALLPLTLTDPNVAGGQANTNALLELETFNQSTTDQTVALLAVFYPESGNTTPSLTINSTTGAITGSYTNVGSSDAGVFTAAPEPSGLTLLALGAGGILARRQRRRAA
jgi:hypothetical protein